MVLPGADWKNQPDHLIDWMTVVTGLALIGVYAVSAWMDSRAPYFIMTGVLVVWLVIFFTSLWQPILSLIMVFIIASFTTILILGGFWEQALDQAAILLNVIFSVFHLYLGIVEHRPQ